LTLVSLNDNIKLVMNKLKTVTDCPVCSKKRSLQMGNVISNKEGSLMIYNKCPHCASAFMAVVSGSRERGLVVVETLTDLSYEEALRVQDKPVLTADAVLEIYQSV